MSIDDLTTEECMTLDVETLELLNKQSVQERQAFDWHAALALTSQYSTEHADGIDCLRIEDEIDFCSAD